MLGVLLLWRKSTGSHHLLGLLIYTVLCRCCCVYLRPKCREIFKKSCGLKISISLWYKLQFQLMVLYLVFIIHLWCILPMIPNSRAPTPVWPCKTLYLCKLDVTGYSEVFCWWLYETRPAGNGNVGLREEGRREGVEGCLIPLGTQNRWMSTSCS